MDLRSAPRLLKSRAGDLVGEGGDDGGNDLVLNLEDLAEAAVVALGPKMPTAVAVDQLRGDPHAVACLSDTAFQDVSDAQFPSDSLQVGWPFTIVEGGVARRHR